jgi:hypothetical protein
MTGVKGGVSKVLNHYFSAIPHHVTEILVRWDVK